ncbi:inositol polyphosphate multikinase isoform X1 [Carcharodon carcharias]|uniref:inositol polyphosphate multikinase isoform X1 n=1 Tax=Carcharodon carcharias TaxID=13397 RepID=UPI001B7F72B5|nr:inositol polyphosphate multikinase isoform X1 [Carcharodon carcharias]
MDSGLSSAGPAPSLGLGLGLHRFPNGCTPLSHQVAGHKYGKSELGMLQHPDGTVLKQLQPPPRGPRELNFYNMVFGSSCHEHVFLDLRKFLPKFLGTWTPTTAPNELYLKLEDVTRKFNKPCIMDVKIGKKSYDPDASAEKIQQQISKYPLMEEIGFLVLGMRVYQFSSDSYMTYDQRYGRGLTKETLKDGLSRFFHDGNCLRKNAVASSIREVEKILQWFENQNKLCFYASSLLFVYEGSPQLTAIDAGDESHKLAAPKGIKRTGEVVEYNNNVHVMSSSENGMMEASVGQSLSNMYALHRKGCSRAHQTVVPLQLKNAEQDHSICKCLTLVSPGQPNSNEIKHLEKDLMHTSSMLQEPPEVDVRMIDFAHVFPSNTKDEEYIYGLKHLISVLQNLLDD